MKNFPLLIISLFFLLSSSNVSKACNLPAAVVTIQSNTACVISISWASVPNTSYYKVRYKLSGSSTWLKTTNVGLVTSYIITGIDPGTTYVVRVIPFCSDDTGGPNTDKTITTPECSAPQHVSSFVINDKSARISWTPCGNFTNSRVRYKVQGTATWTAYNTGLDTFTVIHGLTPATTYTYEVNTCSGVKVWSPPATFKTLNAGEWRPNVIVFYLDDSRFDPFAPNGGPSFYESPGINRIAEEGVNFKNSYATLPLCAPCRATLMTGLYPHHHGVYNNGAGSTFPYITVAQILHGLGYYTGFVGKYGFQDFPDVTGYDYYLESSNDIYWNSDYDYNGQFNVVIPGHKTDVITDKAFEFLHSVPEGERFLLYVNHKAPHVPYTPRTQDDGIYAQANLPFPPNFKKYTNNYPSNYYDCSASTGDSAVLRADIEGYYELLAGAEASIDSIMNYLDAQGILDSTLVIFSSDQGILKGEHKLGGKEIGLDESMHVPMFIRFPKWFAPGSVVSDEISVNIDIAPTILDAVGIPDTFNMDGFSMRALANHTLHRNLLFYEYFFRETCKPTMTGVRDFNYKFISTDCSTTTEEFYDLINDPQENTNKINASSYSTLVNKYRAKLDSMKTATGYIDIVDTTLPCSLKKPKYTKNELTESGDAPDFTATIYPNPGGANFTLELVLGKAGNVTVSVTDIFSQQVREKRIEGNQVQYTVDFDCTSLPAGVYMVQIKTAALEKVIRYLKIE